MFSHTSSVRFIVKRFALSALLALACGWGLLQAQEKVASGVGAAPAKTAVPGTQRDKQKQTPSATAAPSTVSERPAMARQASRAVSPTCEACLAQAASKQCGVRVCGAHVGGCNKRFSAAAVAEAGPGHGTSRRKLCTALRDCVYSTKCATHGSTDCLCGELGDTGECFNTPLSSLPGACKLELAAAAEADDILALANHFTDVQYGSGAVAAELECALTACRKSCGLCNPASTDPTDPSRCPSEREPLCDSHRIEPKHGK